MDTISYCTKIEDTSVSLSCFSRITKWLLIWTQLLKSVSLWLELLLSGLKAVSLYLEILLTEYWILLKAWILSPKGNSFWGQSQTSLFLYGGVSQSLDILMHRVKGLGCGVSQWDTFGIHLCFLKGLGGSFLQDC